MAELINNLQQRTLRAFARSPLRKKFYWAGGTALAVVYLKHRRSQDLDFFSKSAVSHQEVFAFVKHLKSEAGLSRIEEKHIHDRWEFFIHNKDHVRLEFVQYPHPRLKKPNMWQGIAVDSLDDMAANKIMALLERNDPKDIFDLYFLMTKKGYKVSRLLRMVQRKFGVKYEKGLFWSEAHKALRDMKELSPMLVVKSIKEKKKLLKRIEEYIADQSNRYLRRYLR